MKRKISYFLLAFLIFSPIKASEVMQKYYSDIKNNYSGYASAKYLGYKLSESYISSIMNDWYEEYYKLGYKKKDTVDKFTREELFLAFSALQEYNLKKDEVYSVVIRRESNNLCFIAVIDSQEHFYWYGGAVFAPY